MDFIVLKSNHKLLPHFGIVNSDGQTIFITVNHDPRWKGEVFQEGEYTSRAWIPGNFLAEGLFYVNASMITLSPTVTQFHEPSIVSCMVVDSKDGDSARGEYTGPMPGVVRPLLKWKTEKR
jgi:lipopolysaccharide transport system ATP-binding protein